MRRSPLAAPTSEANTMAAVSVRNTRGPIKVHCHPFSQANAISAWSKPPSGPTAKVQEVSSVSFGADVAPGARIKRA